MTRFTVTYSDVAYEDLAREWLASTDRGLVTHSANEIESALRRDALLQGEEVQEGLRRIIVAPLKAQFTVSEEDLIVTIWSFGRSG